MKEHTEVHCAREIHTLPISKTYSLQKVQSLCFLVLSALVTSRTPQKLGPDIIHNNLKAKLTGPSSFLEQKIQTKLVLRHTSNHSAKEYTVAGWYALCMLLVNWLYSVLCSHNQANLLHINLLMTKVIDKPVLISYWFYFFLLTLLFG